LSTLDAPQVDLINSEISTIRQLPSHIHPVLGGSHEHGLMYSQEIQSHFKINQMSWVLVAHTYDLSYLKG
jgi:hypothetical protein